MTLADIKPGNCCVITSVGGEGALRRRFLDMGLTPRTRVLVRKVAPMGDPIELCLRGYELTIRSEDAERISVHPDSSCAILFGEGGCGSCPMCAGKEQKR